MTTDMRVERSSISLKKLALESLRSGIISGTFAPGERLIERELCEKLDVSRTLVREVLSQLETEGLVRLIPHKGPIVALYTPEEAKSIYQVRAALEELAGQLCALNASAAEIKTVQSAFGRLKEAYRSGRSEPILVAKAKFYEALCAGTHNTALTDLLRMIHGRVTMLRAQTLSTPGRRTASLAELNEIVRALLAREANQTGAACRKHVENAAAVAAELLAARVDVSHKATGLQATGNVNRSAAAAA